jgi:hypothetical protein
MIASSKIVPVFLSPSLFRSISFLLPSLVSVQTDDVQQLAVKAFVKAVAIVGKWKF